MTAQPVNISGGGDPALGGDLTGTASAAQIAAGAIVNADVNANAAITEQGKLSLINRIPEPYLTDYGLVTSGNAVTLNHIRGVKYRWPKSGTILGIGLFVTLTSAGGNNVVGIYDNAATNLNLLKGSASVAVGGTATWNDVPLSSGLAVNAGDDAYIVLHTDNSTATYARSGALASTNAQGPLPAGYMTGADGLSMRSWDFNRGSYSSPLPNQISVASIVVAAPIIFAVRYQ